MTRVDRFNEVLATCLAELETGRDAATCAARYPEYPQLGRLLALAAELRALPRPAPDPARAALADERVRLALVQLCELPDIRMMGGLAPAAAPAETAPLSHGLQRRRHPRVPVRLDGTLRLVQRSGQRRRIPITVVDISASGLGFQSAERLEPGLAVEIELRLPGASDPRAQPEPPSIVAVLARQWPQPAPHSPAPSQRHTRSARLAAVARVVHCSAPHAAAVADQPAALYRGGAEIVALKNRVQRTRR